MNFRTVHTAAMINRVSDLRSIWIRHDHMRIQILSVDRILSFKSPLLTAAATAISRNKYQKSIAENLSS